MPALWRDLPFWFLWLASFALLDFEINQLQGPLAGALFGFVLPFSLVTLAFGREGGGSRAWLAYGLTSAGLLLVIVAGWTGPALDPSLRHRVFEASAVAEFVLLGVHAWRVAGRGIFALIFGVGLAYGLILENVGVGLGFFSEPGYRIHLPLLPAPVATVLGWSVIFYCLWWIVPRLLPTGAGRGRRSITAVGVALALDLQLDPLATAAGFWVWNPDLPPVVRGVPLVNFSAWAAAVLPFSWAAFRPVRSSSPAWQVALRLPWILGAAGVLVLVLVTLTEARDDWPSFRLLAGAARSMLGLSG